MLLPPQSVPALIILFANPTTLVGKALSLKVFVGVGLISYSAYLWHQPIFAFYRILYVDQAPVGLLFALILICFLLAYLTWLLVEKPVRYKLPRAMLLPGAAFASVLVIGAGALLASGSVGRTFTAVQIAQMSPINGNRQLELEKCPSAASLYNFEVCSRHPELQTKAVLYGDSHARAIYSGLSDALAASGIDLMLLRNEENIQFDCEPMLGSFRYGRFAPQMKAWCAERTLEIARIANRLGADYLFVSLRYTFRLYPATGMIESLDYDNGEGGVGDENYREYFVLDADGSASVSPVDKLAATSAAFKSLIDEFNGRVAFIGPVPEVGWRVENLNRSSILLFGAVEQTISTDYERFKVRNRLANDILQSVAEYGRAIIIQPADLFCNRFLPDRCVAQVNAVPLYTDDDHLSLEGAKLLAAHIVDELKEKKAWR